MPFGIKLHFVLLMLQIKVIDCKNAYLLGALREIKTLNQAYDLYKINK